ncbi:MAG: ribosome small subunit-dependent GTPase A [Planctomyces sp.]|nr:ribosome small subunit-dependent GTPase A [Planctomyces sp.]
MAKKPKPQLRADLLKNRSSRGRKNDFTRDMEVDADRVMDMRGSERVRGRNEMSRKRTVRGASVDGDRIVLDIDTTTALFGRVLSSVGSTQCTVQVEDGRRFMCSVRRIVRTMARETRNAVAAGDRVWITATDEKTGVIERVEPRQGVLSRGHQNRQHVLVANVTQMLIVGSAAQPNLKPALIDRFLVSAGKGEVHPIVCINKIDLVDPLELQPLLGWYSQIGCDVVMTSVTTGYGVDRLRMLLQNEQTVFAGQSGVGKSSLLNAVQPGLSLSTGIVSEVTQKGKHTTRYTQLLALNGGGWVVDTPGIRQLELWDVRPEEIEGYFVEFRPFVALCRYPDCRHYREDDCAIRRAVQMDLIPRVRYESYLRMMLGDDA